MLVNRAVLIEIAIPAIGFNIAVVLELIVEADPIKIPVISKNTSCLFQDISFFL